MKTTGELLKEAREKKGVSLGEVSLATKINTRILKAIEDGDMKALPPKTFIRGFVQTYAQFLQLDVDEVLNHFHNEMGSTKPQIKAIEDGSAAADESNHQAAPTPQQTVDHVNRGSRAGLWKVIGIIVAILGLIGAIRLVKKMESYQAETVVAELPEVEAISEDPALGEGESPLTPDPVPLTPAASPLPAGAATSGATPPAALGASPTPLRAATPLPAPSPRATATPAATTAAARPSPTPVTAPTATATPAATAKPAAPASPTPAPRAAGGKREILIEALAPVTVEVTSNGKTEKFSLAADEVRTLKSDGPMKVKYSNGGAVNISRGGRDLGEAGPLGKAAEVDY